MTDGIAPDPSTPAQPLAIASMLRQRVQREPLWIPVHGASMGRTIAAGSEVLIAARRAPRLGEVWAFCDERGTLVVHRYMGRRHDSLRMQGDAQYEDPAVSADALIGRVIAVRREGRGRALGERERVVRGLRLLVYRRARAVAGRARRRVRRALSR